MCLKISRELHYLCREVDHKCEVLESYVTKTRDRKAAHQFMTKSMRRHGRPDVIVTDKLRSYGLSWKVLGRGDDREVGRWMTIAPRIRTCPFQKVGALDANIPADAMFASVHASISNHFDQERTLSPCHSYKGQDS